MAPVLHDLTVLDLSRGIAGPMTAMLLADNGARVIKVEPPGGDPTRSMPGARVWHRGKESVVLDLRSDQGMECLWTLIDRADVLIESEEPGSGAHPGLSFDTAHQRNPRLVLCSITGYGGSTGHAGRPVDDALVAARTGLLWEKRGWPGGSIERVNRIEPYLPDFPVPPDEMEGPPRDGPLFSSVPWPSLSAFHLASVGIAAALHAREVTGRGQQVTTSLLQGALINGTFTWQRVENPGRPGYRMWVTDPRLPHGFFRTQDERWVHHWVPQPGFVLRVSAGSELEANVSGRALKTDGSRIGMDPEELVALHELYEPMCQAFARYPADEWVRVAAEVGVSVQPVRSPEEALSDPLFMADGCVTEVDDPEIGPIRQVGITIHLSASPGVVRGPAPRIGEHTHRILAELATGPAPAVGAAVRSTPDTPEPRRPLDGIRVLDLGLAVAGPFGTQMLADLGADVIKVNRPSDQAWMVTTMGMCCNRGKRSVALDLKSERGIEVLRQLAKRADVVHTNMRYDAAEQLGVDYQALRQVNSRLIYCHTRGFENGPRMLLPGHDQSASALTGVAWEEGGVSAGGKPIWPNISLGDTGNGLLSATAVLQALYHRDRTGEGQFVDTSILYAHLLNMSSWWITGDGISSPDHRRLDAQQFGLAALYRLYRCEEGWICIAAEGEDHWSQLAGALGRTDLVGDPRFVDAAARARHDTELIAELEPTFGTRTATAWAEILDAAGVPAEVSSETFSLELFDDPEMRERGWTIALEQSLVGTFEAPGQTIGFSEGGGTSNLPPIVVGRHTREILAELGYSPQDIDELIATGVVTAA